jgi:predicted RNase H-like HicB family nuclease
MAKYAYPAIFTKEETGYSVSFPDIDGCFTCGDTLPEAVEMAEDALCLMLYDHEEDGEPIPDASDIKVIQAQRSEIVSLVCCDTVEYRKLYDSRAVKKTLTIPNWLNTMADRAGVNFSTVLQDALKAKLDIN